jgi:hypothetical protein
VHCAAFSVTDSSAALATSADRTSIAAANIEIEEKGSVTKLGIRFMADFGFGAAATAGPVNQTDRPKSFRLGRFRRLDKQISPHPIHTTF